MLNYFIAENFKSPSRDSLQIDSAAVGLSPRLRKHRHQGMGFCLSRQALDKCLLSTLMSLSVWEFKSHGNICCPRGQPRNQQSQLNANAVARAGVTDNSRGPRSEVQGPRPEARVARQFRCSARGEVRSDLIRKFNFLSLGEL